MPLNRLQWNARRAEPPLTLRSTLLSTPLTILLTTLPASAAHSQNATTQLDPVVVTATRLQERAFDVPVSIDSIDASVIQNGQLQVNLSEALNRVPGIVVQNRQNYAQDLQISSRGFGARASFGVRGVRIYQDGIPATMPDGQGQTGSFGLTSAQRIEVLRGPFSTLYGNASGGVIQVFTEDGPDTVLPTVTPLYAFGSNGTSNTSLKLGGQNDSFIGPLNYVAAANHFATDGYREHSAARRDLVNAKLKFALAPGTRLTLIVNTLDQPAAQDPLGLTRAAWQANPRGVDPVALQFDTRKTVQQQQLGLALDQDLGGVWGNNAQLHVTAYRGTRQLRQYLALSGAALSSSGGVVDLDRDFGGLGARLSTQLGPVDAPLTLSVGADYDSQQEHRRGYVNNNGTAGDLRRDEQDSVTNADAYAQAEWLFLPRWKATVGARASSLRFTSEDRYINAVNGDDSGKRDYSHTSPVAGLLYRANDNLSLYANAGSGFETPTFAEMAYKSSGTGINLGLNASTSRSVEAGIKAIVAGQQRITFAVFQTDTSNEIVIDTAVNGRTTYKNAGQTRRRGLEAEWSGPLLRSVVDGVSGYAACTWLEATYQTAFLTGTPAATVAIGSKLPGLPQNSLYAELVWRPADLVLASHFETALEAQYADQVFVNDRNSDAAPAYAVVNARIGLAQDWNKVTLRQFLRVNNLNNRRYAGSVIVGDTNGRFFEPAPGRNWIAGASASMTF